LSSQASKAFAATRQQPQGRYYGEMPLNQACKLSLDNIEVVFSHR